MRWIVVTACLVIAVAGCAMEQVDSVSAAATTVESCSVVAFGTLAAGDDFDGDATALDGLTGGTWTHQTPERDVVVCDDDGGCCRHPGWCIGRGHFRHGRGHGRGHDRHHHSRCTTTTERDTFVGNVTSLSCSINGGSVGNLAGTGTWNGAPGYTFTADVLDDDDDTSDFYTITISDPGGTIIYTANGIPTSGDIAVVGL